MIAGVVLAAGEATRFGSPKQRLLLATVLERARESAALDQLVVVAGAYTLEVDAPVVYCPRWADGPGGSLHCGLDALDASVEAAVVLLADGPDLNPRAIDRVVAEWRRTGAPVIAAAYGGVRGHPILIARGAWPDVPDEGARALTPVLVPCDDLGPPGDVDTPADLPGRLRAGEGEH